VDLIKLEDRGSRAVIDRRGGGVVRNARLPERQQWRKDRDAERETAEPQSEMVRLIGDLCRYRRR
jgi:hypothetical protein